MYIGTWEKYTVDITFGKVSQQYYINSSQTAITKWEVLLIKQQGTPYFRPLSGTASIAGLLSSPEGLMCVQGNRWEENCIENFPSDKWFERIHGLLNQVKNVYMLSLQRGANNKFMK